MKVAKLSLALVLMGGVACAEDAFAEAFLNGKFKGEVRAWHWSKKDESAGFNDTKRITNFAVELGYETADYYGFYLGSTIQGAFAPIGNSDAKSLYNLEQDTKGVVFSELYLGYKFGKTDIKVGRQYVNTPLVAMTNSRILKESFSGVTISSKELANTEIYAGYLDRYQGRTSSVASNEIGKEPKFKKRIVLGGVTPRAHEFDGVYYAGVTNNSISNLTLSAQYALINDVEFWFAPNKEGDIQLYYTEANYEVPMDSYKFKFDVNFRGSEVDGGLDARNYDGWMFGARAGVYGLNGFNLSAAYTTVSSDDSVIMSAGLGGTSYTHMPVRGSHHFTALAGMDTYKFQVDYSFAKVGIKGLGASAQYYITDHDAPDNVYGAPVNKAGMKREFDGYVLSLNYNVPQIKGLNLNVVWASLDEERTPKGGSTTKYDTDELWLKANYKF
ncbi:MAG: OprD family porin [Campylobacteraceae bacterium]|nr:OprD family porin [Campylobacteraceae bacterium]